MAEGQITRKDIIQDEALAWGGEYAKLMDAAIGKNKEFVSGIITMKEESEKLRKAQNQTEYRDSLNAVNLESKKTILALKEQLTVEVSLEKIKKEKIQTSKSELDLDVKKAKANSEITKLLAEEERLSQQKLKTEKEKLIVEKQLIEIETKKQQLKNAGISVSKAELDLLQKEETIKKNKLKQLQDEENKLKQLQEVSKQSIVVWKEQNQLELALISTKRKNELATEGTNRALVKERLELALVNKEIKQETMERLGLVSAYTKLNNSRTEAKNKLRDLIATETASTAELKKASAEFEKLDAKVKKADTAVGDFTKNVGNYPKLTSFTSGIKNLFAAFGLVGGIAAFASVMKGAINIIKEFDQSIADLQAITGASGKDLEYLKNQAIELGKATKGGATAVVEAYKLIASAKPELLENVQALNQVTEAVLTLSKASGMEMPAAAIALTDAMNQFNAPAEQAGIFIDALANGAKYGAAEIPQVTEALLKFGAVAKSSNISIQESTALIELLAENGLKGADAGTALRNVLLKISAPDALPKRAFGEFSKALEASGVSMEFMKDKTIPIQQKLEALKPLLKDNASIVKVFGLENATAAINVLSHTDRLKELTSKMFENGTAAEQASLRSDTLIGSFDRLESAWSSFILSLSEKGNGLGSLLKGITNELTDTVEGWRKIFTSNEKLKEEDLNKTRKEGFDSIVKSYSDKNKLNEGQLNLIKKLNSDEITENANKVNALIADNKRLSQNTVFLTGAIKSDSFAKIMENRKKIADLNKTSTGLLGKNEGINSLIKSRQPGKTDPTDVNTNENADAENAKEKAAREKAIKDRLDAEKRLSDSLYELQKQKLERSIQINDEVAKDEEQTDEIRIAALEASNKKQIILTELTKKHSLDADKFVTSENKLNANQKTFIANEAANKIIDINKKTSDEIEKIRVFDEKVFTDDLLKKITDVEIASDKAVAIENDEYKKILENKKLSDKEIEDATKKHEEELFNIKLNASKELAKILIANTELELAAYKQQSDGSEKSNAFILALEKKLYDAKVKLSELGLETFKKDEETKVMTAKEKAVMTLEIAMQVTGELANLASAFSERKIQKIDEEIDKNNEYYDKQIELAGNDERQKDLLSKERDKKNEALEKKKRAAQHKQAVFDKAINVAMIAMATALAVIKAYTEGDPYTKIARSIIAGVVGAIQLAAALATPIPKYKMGRLGGPAETAWVGDGGISEVITKGDGSNPRLTPNTPTLTSLGQGDIVHKSVEDYNRYIRASILSGFNQDHRKMNEFQANQNADLYGKEMLEELKRNTNAILNKRFHSNDSQKIDIPHSIWAYKNTNWS